MYTEQEIAKSATVENKLNLREGVDEILTACNAPSNSQTRCAAVNVRLAQIAWFRLDAGSLAGASLKRIKEIDAADQQYERARRILT